MTTSKKGNSKKNKNVYVCNNRGKKNKRNYDLSPPSRCLLSFLIFGLAAKLAQLKFSAAHLAIDLEFPLQNLIKHLLWRGEGRGKALTRLKKQDERKNAANWSRQSCWPRRALQRVDLKRKAEHTNFKLMAQ